MRIVITTRKFAHASAAPLEALRAAGHDATVYDGPTKIGNGTPIDKLYEIVKDAEAIVAGTERYPAELIGRLPKLRMITRRGVGYDAIDIQACSERGITVMRTLGAVEGAVAEHVMAYVLHFARRIAEQSATMHKRIWAPMQPPGAKTRTIGLVGFGGIGKEIARRAHPFGMRILYNCRHPNPAWQAEYHAEYRELPDLLAESDYVSMNTPLTPETRGMIGARELARMKPTAVLINIARGPVVDEHALAQALKNGVIAGAAVDVFASEPCTDSPLVECPNAVLTPHTASGTEENGILMSAVAAQNILDWAAGHPDPAKVVAWPKGRRP